VQIVFKTDRRVEDFSVQKAELFPDEPLKCPFKDCSMPVKLKKHGYYARYYISRRFNGIIYIRRYICPVCGRTVSMLPVFCLPRFQYSALDIFNMLYELNKLGESLKKYIARIKKYFSAIGRRHLNYYKRRILNNRQFIQYGLNLISPGFLNAGILENQKWVKRFLEEVNNLSIQVFLINFYQHTGKSFMTTKI
jgi:transposase-like protein